ncbi:MAG: GNAT family N-acetyltransferase [Burkholderiaceae bacterium]
MPDIRPATATDLDALLALYAEIRPDSPPVPRSAELDDTWRAMLANPSIRVAVAERDGALQATAMLAIIPSVAKGPAPFGVIEHVVTTAAARGQGLAERLMRRLIDEAWRAGCYKLMLLSGSQRDGAHRLYQKLGFDGDVERGFVLKRPPSTCSR